MTAEQKFTPQKMSVLNLRKKVCHGCKKTRSEQQFAKASSYCKQCVLRGLNK